MHFNTSDDNAQYTDERYEEYFKKLHCSRKLLMAVVHDARFSQSLRLSVRLIPALNNE